MGIKKVSKDFYIFILMVLSLGAVVPTLTYAVSKFLNVQFDIYGVGIFVFVLFIACLVYLTIRAKKGKLNLDFLVRYEDGKE